jgi:hypothetical protein
MHRLAIAAILVLALCGCSTDSPKQSPVVTEQDARLISVARSAATAEGFSLVDAIYQVRRDGDGWIVQVDKAPGYTGVGEPLVVVDGTYFVKFGADGQVREIVSHGRRIRSTPRPGGRP